jgi:TolB-like protein
MVKAGDEISTAPQIEAYLEIGVGADVLDRLLERSLDVVGFNSGATSCGQRAVHRHVSTAQKARHLPASVRSNADRDH